MLVSTDWACPLPPPVLYFSLPFNRNICCHHCCFRGNQAVINIKLINTFRTLCQESNYVTPESREMRDVILYKGGREAAAGRADRLCNNGIVAQRHNSCIVTILHILAAPFVFACCKLWSALDSILSRRWFPCTTDLQTIPPTTTG